MSTGLEDALKDLLAGAGEIDAGVKDAKKTASKVRRKYVAAPRLSRGKS